MLKDSSVSRAYPVMLPETLPDRQTDRVMAFDVATGLDVPPTFDPGTFTTEIIEASGRR